MKQTKSKDGEELFKKVIPLEVQELFKECRLVHNKKVSEYRNRPEVKARIKENNRLRYLKKKDDRHKNASLS